MLNSNCVNRSCPRYVHHQTKVRLIVNSIAVGVVQRPPTGVQSSTPVAFDEQQIYSYTVSCPSRMLLVVAVHHCLGIASFIELARSAQPVCVRVVRQQAKHSGTGRNLNDEVFPSETYHGFCRARQSWCFTALCFQRRCFLVLKTILRLTRISVSAD